MSSQKVLFVGDPHFKLKNVEYIPLFVSRIMDIVTSEKLNFVVVAGDLLDNHDRIDVGPLNLAIDFIDSLSQKIKTFVLVGNHDYINNQQFLSNSHWMNALKHWKNVVIVDDVVSYGQFLFVPYVPPGRFMEAINTKIPKEEIKNFKAIFAHQEFYGCKMGPIISQDGDKWPDDCSIVVSGHIHNKQWSQKNIYYPGSAMQHAFGQSIENTVSLLIFSSNNELRYEEIDLKMPKLSIKYLSIDDVMQPLKFENSEFRKYKIVVEGTQEEFKTFKKTKRYKELLEEQFKITFKIKNLVVVQTSNLPKKSFMDVLNDKIKEENDPDLELIFKKFFTN